jgi:hypothetical protein
MQHRQSTNARFERSRALVPAALGARAIRVWRTALSGVQVAGAVRDEQEARRRPGLVAEPDALTPRALRARRWFPVESALAHPVRSRAADP